MSSQRHRKDRPTRPFKRIWNTYTNPNSASDSPSVPAKIRVLSFNVLAEYIVIKDTRVARQDKYKWTNRRHKLVREIIQWSPHIVCLQEVDHFYDYFEPELGRHGFIGTYKKRTGDTTHDGCAIFVRSDMFTIISEHPIEFFESVSSVLDRHNVAQQVVLEWKQPNVETPPKKFILANTHLLFNPGRGDVKLAQIERLMNSLAHLREIGTSALLPVLICGDFNLTPYSALYHLLCKGYVDVSGLSKYFLSGQNMTAAQQNAVYINEQDRRHYGHGTSIGRFYSQYSSHTEVKTHKLSLASAYAQDPDDHTTGEPKFTTFHSGSKSTVDYIWYTTESIHCHGVVEMVPAGLLFAAKELPTTHHGSDHLSLIAEFSFTI